MASVKPKSAQANHERAAKPITSMNSDLSSSTMEGEKPAKRLPPIKAPVGIAKGPDLKNVRSKVGSLNNIQHKPTGSGVVIPSQKLTWSAKSKIGSLENKEHQPGGGKLKVETRKLDWKTESKVQSLANIKHKPGGGHIKIFNESYVEKPTNKGDNSQEVQSSPQADKNESNETKSLARCMGSLSIEK